MLAREENVATTGQFDNVLNKERREMIKKGYAGTQTKNENTSLQQSCSEGSQGEEARDEGRYRGSRQGVNSSSRDKREEPYSPRDNHSSSKRSRDEQFDSGSYQSSRYNERDRDRDHGRYTYR